MVVKTYRGLLAHGGQDRIRLQTIKGKVGYRIMKFEIMTDNPGTSDFESIVKIYKTEQSSVDGAVNFTEDTLLAAVTAAGDATSNNYPTHITTIFDQEIFNQDIYVTHAEVSGNNPGSNYYIELEVIPLDDAGAEYTTLKDMRQS